MSQRSNAQSGQGNLVESGRVKFVISAFLVVLVFAVFGQTAGFGFVNYDDGIYVYQNPVVRAGLTWKGIVWAFTYGQIGHWHPLTWLTHLMDCQIYGMSAGGPHLENVAWHAVSTVLLFLILTSMTAALWRSAFVAAIFAVHPLRAESVAWVAERKDVLSGMFFMLTLWAYVCYARRPARGRYAVVVLCYFLGLLCKNMLVTLPFVLILLDWCPSRRMTDGKGGGFWNLVKEKIPLFVLAAGSCVATALVPEKIWTGGHVGLAARMGNAAVSYLVYLRQTVFPKNLMIPYLFPPGGLPAWEIAGAFAIIVALTAAAWVCRRQRPYILIGWLWYLGMLVPAIGLVQISYYSHADRYTYLPAIGVTVAVVWAVADMVSAWKMRRVLAGLMLGVVGFFAVACYRQTSYWHDSQKLWTHTLDCAPDNCIAHNCLGLALAEKGETAQAIVEYRKALELSPDYAEAFNNLGMALFETGATNEAIAQYQKAIHFNPEYAEAMGNLGVALFSMGKKEEAMAEYREALEIKPDDVEARSNLGIALSDKGEADAAIAEYHRALETDPSYEKAEYNLGNALANEGKMDEAMAHFRKAAALKPDYAYARFGWGTALATEQKWDDAAAQFRMALASRPDFPEARRGLGKALLRKGALNEALRAFQTNSIVNTNSFMLWRDLGNDLLRSRDAAESVMCFQQAVKLDPSAGGIYASLGLACFEAGMAGPAAEAWRQSLKFKPDDPSVENNLAWVLATAPDSAVRNGGQAVALAEQASQRGGSTNAAVLHTLAAAYAEAGRFKDASATAQRALALAEAQHQQDLLDRLPEEIKLYQAERPLRDGAR